MTNEEIIKGIKLCNGGQYCDKCPFANVKPKKNRTCCEQLMLEAGRLIARQEEELAALRERLPVWVPVTEALPPDQEEVLVLTQSKNGVRNIGKGYWSIDHFIHRGRAQVTHWTPLPAMPKEVENDG